MTYSCFVEQVLEYASGAGTFLTNQEFLASQFGLRYTPAAPQRVVCGSDDYMGVRPERLAFYAKVPRRAPHQSHVDVVVAEGFDDLGAISNDKLEVDPYMLAQESRDKLGRKIFCCRHRAKANAAAVKSLHCFKRVGEIRKAAINARGGGNDFTTGVGGMQAVSGAVKQCETQVFFEELDPRS